MKISFNLLIPLFVLQLLLNNNLFSQKPELYIEFSTEKKDYLIHELVIFNYKISNNFDTKFNIDIDCTIEIDIYRSLNLFRNDSIKLGYCGISIGCVGDKIIIKPHEEINTEVNELFGYGMELLFGYGYLTAGSKNLYGYLPAGRYSIFFNNYQGGKYSINSNRVSFNIVEPSDKDGFGQFRKIDTMAHSNEKYDEIKKFLTDYPESGYKLNIYFTLLLMSWLNNIYPEKILEDMKRFVQSDYNAWTIGTYVMYCAQRTNLLKGEDEMINYLVDIIHKFPESYAARAAIGLLYKEIPNHLYVKNLIEE